MMIETKEYGLVEVDEEAQTFEFVQGIPAFEALRRWVLFPAEVQPFFVLQSVEEVNTAFFLLSPWVCRADYEPALATVDLNALGLDDDKDPNILVMAIITVPMGCPEAMSVNLQAPLVFNVNTKQALQAVSTDERWGMRHSLSESSVPLRGDVEC